MVDESWLTDHRNTTDRHLKCLIESIVTMKRNRTDRQRVISNYMKITNPKLAATEFDFVTSLMPDYPAPTFDGIPLILENFGKEYPDAPRRNPKEFVDARLSSGSSRNGLRKG